MSLFVAADRGLSEASVPASRSEGQGDASDGTTQPAAPQAITFPDEAASSTLVTGGGLRIRIASPLRLLLLGSLLVVFGVVAWASLDWAIERACAPPSHLQPIPPLFRLVHASP